MALDLAVRGSGSAPSPTPASFSAFAAGLDAGAGVKVTFDNLRATIRLDYGNVPAIAVLPAASWMLLQDALSGVMQKIDSNALAASIAGVTLANAALKGDNADISRLRGVSGAGIEFWSSETAVSGQGTCDLSAITTRKVGLTITGPITSFGSGAHREKILRFANVGTLTQGAALSLPTGANITTAVGDRALFVSDASGNGIVVAYMRADGSPLKNTTIVAADISDASANGRSLIKAVDYAAMRALLALVVGTNVQAWDGDLDALAALTTTAFGRDFNTLVDAAAARTKIGAQAALGFTPVQQGGGASQGTNKIFIGYDGANGFVRLQVDGTDFGRVWIEAQTAISQAVGGWYVKFPNGFIIQGSNLTVNAGDFTPTFPLAFTTVCLFVGANPNIATGSGVIVSARADSWTKTTTNIRTTSATSGTVSSQSNVPVSFVAIGF